MPTVPGEDTWRQKVRLQPTGSQVLFAMAGPVSISMNHHGTIRCSAYDQSLQNGDAPSQPIDYEVVSNGRIPYKTYPPDVQRPWRPWNSGSPDDRPASSIDPKIRDYARDPQVSGVGPGNVPLIELRRQALEALKAQGADPGEQRSAERGTADRGEDGSRDRSRDKEKLNCSSKLPSRCS
jgi:hypothetical protein